MARSESLPESSLFNRPKRKKLSPSRRREALAFYLTISPWLLGFVLLFLGPMLYSLYISFTRWDLLTDPL